MNDKQKQALQKAIEKHLGAAWEFEARSAALFIEPLIDAMLAEATTNAVKDFLKDFGEPMHMVCPDVLKKHNVKVAAEATANALRDAAELCDDVAHELYAAGKTAQGDEWDDASNRIRSLIPAGTEREQRVRVLREKGEILDKLNQRLTSGPYCKHDSREIVSDFRADLQRQIDAETEKL